MYAYLVFFFLVFIYFFLYFVAFFFNNAKYFYKINPEMVKEKNIPRHFYHTSLLLLLLFGFLFLLFFDDGHIFFDCVRI